MEFSVVSLGMINYHKALQLQQKLVQMRQAQQIGDVLILLEHPPVLTLGKRGNDSNIIVSKAFLKLHQVEIIAVDRGGDVTYHGPGQIVGYPIMDLNRHGKDIKYFIWRLEEVFIRLLREEYGIPAFRDEKRYTGVWVGNQKITAIGVAVHHWITSHGFAFNVNANLEHFKWINPCGILDKGVTSLQQLLGIPQDLAHLKQLIIQYFCEVFELKSPPTRVADL